MEIFKTLKFLNRFTKISKNIFCKKTKLTIPEIDLVLKLQNFAIFNVVKPNLSYISECSGVSLRTFGRTLKNLKDKKFISVVQNRNEKGMFETNSYDMSGLFSHLDNTTESNQMTLSDISSVSNVPFSFGEESSALVPVFYTPRALDSFQKELNLSTYEIVFIKFLLSRTDSKAVSQISLNWVSRNTVFSRKKLTEVIASLQEKNLIKVKEQFYGRTKLRVFNRYDLSPLLEKLNELERQKVENKLRESGVWKDYEKSRKRGNIVVIENNEDSITSKNYENIKNRINFLKKEISRLENYGKNSPEMDTVREYQKELNQYTFSSSEDNLMSSIIKKRFEKLQKNIIAQTEEDILKAKYICKRLNGNWEKSSNFYIKAVKMYPNTIDRYVVTTIEKAKKNKERYFTTMVSKLFV